METEATSQTTMYPTKVLRSVYRFPLKMTSAVTAPLTTVSTRMHCHRLSGMPIACRVTPDEYMSRVLIANSWRMATIMNGQKNQSAVAENAEGSPTRFPVAATLAVTMKDRKST